MIGLNARRRVDGNEVNFLRRLGRHLLDIHAAFGRRHDGDVAGFAVHEHSEVKLAVDIATVLDVDAFDFLARRAGLMRNQSHAQDLVGGGARVFEGFDDLDATAFAASAGMNLRLDHPHGSAEVLGNFARLINREGNAAFRYRDAVLGQKTLCLIFVDIHGGRVACAVGWWKGVPKRSGDPPPPSRKHSKLLPNRIQPTFLSINKRF